MGFYGNVTDTSHTHFQFDKVFSSRTEMDRACALGTDGIYAGRFVLVKYDKTSSFFQGDILYGFESAEPEDHSLYMDTACTRPYIFTTFSLITADQTSADNWDLYYDKPEESNFYFKLPNATYFRDNHDYYVADAGDRDDIVGINTIVRLKDVSVQGLVTSTFMQCVGTTSGEPAEWRIVVSNEEYKDYFTNFELDALTYQEDFDSRGYDATVWQKVYGEGAGKFILIAKLNGITPSFELYPNAPSMDPQAPYIDVKSTNELYRIHVPSSWGLRFKEDRPVADGGLSDQTVTTETIAYDDQGQAQTITSTYNASIYFNKAGFDKEKRTFIPFGIDENTGETYGVSNKLSLDPTGESGKTYYDFNGNPVKKDILELSVHVPAIGNMVADGYDAIYGYDDSTQERYTDIDWIEGDRSDNDKYFGPTGKKTHDLRTIAGTINTMHDTLGQNVIHLSAVPTAEQAADLRDGYIYEVDGNYYRRGIGYKKIIIEEYLYRIDPDAADHFNDVNYPNVADSYHYEATDQVNSNGNTIYVATEDEEADPDKTYYYRVPWCSYDIDPDAASNFATNKYYTEDSGVYYEYTETTYDPTQAPYYLKHINPARFSPIKLLQFQPGIYYYIDGENYICDNNIAEEGPRDPYGAYYQIVGLTAKQFTNIYQANRYHKIVDGDYILQSAAAPDPVDNDYYYLLNPQPAFTYNDPITDELIHQRCIIYAPNIFYKKLKKDPVTSLVIATENEFVRPIDLEDENETHYYALEFSTEATIFQDPITGQIYSAYPVKPGGYHDVTEYLQNKSGSTNYYYKTTGEDGQSANNYILYENLLNIFEDAYWTPRYYYTVGNPTAYLQTQFYLPGRYHVKDNTLSYQKTYETYLNGNGEWMAEEMNFYYIQPSNLVKVLYPFYRPNTYYYDTTGSETYEVDEGALAQVVNSEMIQYYEKTRLFVDYDKRHECPHGFEWSDYAPYIPPSITLYAREEHLAAVPLDKAYSGRTNLTTINDFLLYLNKSYDPDNDETRDLNTFRGVYNSIRDILYLIKKLEPGKVVYVNNFGQLTTGTKNYSDL